MAILLSVDARHDDLPIKDSYHSSADDYIHSMVRLCDLPVRFVDGGSFPCLAGERHRQPIHDWLDEKNQNWYQISV